MAREPGSLTFITSCSGSSLPSCLIQIEASQAKALGCLHTRVYVASESAENPFISVGIVFRKDIQCRKKMQVVVKVVPSVLGNATRVENFSCRHSLTNENLREAGPFMAS